MLQFDRSCGECTTCKYLMRKKLRSVNNNSLDSPRILRISDAKETRPSGLVAGHGLVSGGQMHPPFGGGIIVPITQTSIFFVVRILLRRRQLFPRERRLAWFDPVKLDGLGRCSGRFLKTPCHQHDEGESEKYSEDYSGYRPPWDMAISRSKCITLHRRRGYRGYNGFGGLKANRICRWYDRWGCGGDGSHRRDGTALSHRA